MNTIFCLANANKSTIERLIYREMGDKTRREIRREARQEIQDTKREARRGARETRKEARRKAREEIKRAKWEAKKMFDSHRILEGKEKNQNFQRELNFFNQQMER